MNFSKVISTSVALAALVVSTSSSALLMTISSGGDMRTIVDSDFDNVIDTRQTRINGWEIATSTSVVNHGGYDIFSMESSSLDRSTAAFDDLVIVSLHEGFSDLRSLSAYHEDTSVLSNITGINSAVFTSLIEIRFDAGWMDLSSFTTEGSAAGGSLFEYGLMSGTSDFDLRITQTFNADDDGFNKAAGITTVKVPEPSIIALMGFGLIGLGFVQRRKTKRTA